ncbi:MAG: Replication initiator protein A (RepA) N-terminus [Bacteriophage sp.]|nr:MAG: Replication initiator protein A (RepA) N-terminus [Bacteriophage sp.]
MKDLPPIPELVDRLGFSTAAVYVLLYDHYRKQRKKQRHFHAGRYWVRMPYEAFPRMFPELPEVIVSHALRNLEDEGLLSMVHSGRLSWYVIDREPRRVVQKT